MRLNVKSRPKETENRLKPFHFNQVYGSAVAAEDGGKWTLERITEVTNAGGWRFLCRFLAFSAVSFSVSASAATQLLGLSCWDLPYAATNPASNQT